MAGKKRNGGRGWVYLVSQQNLSGLADPFAIVDTAKCPRLRCRMREQAAIALRSLFEFAVRETIDKAAVASS